MSFYLIVFQGGNAIGSAVMGVTAQHAGLSPVLLAAAAGLALGPLAALRWRFRSIRPDELLPAGDWPAPHLSDGVAADGPVMVAVRYEAQPGKEDELIARLRHARYSRRRTGATSWRAWREASQPGVILEQFIVASWVEHERQHERITRRDQDRLDQVQMLTVEGSEPTVTHWLTARPGPQADSES